VTNCSYSLYRVDSVCSAVVSVGGPQQDATTNWSIIGGESIRRTAAAAATGRDGDAIYFGVTGQRL